MEETAWATEDDAWLGQLGELASGAVLASEMAAGEFFDASEETHVCIESFLSHEDGETMPRTRDLPHIVTSLRADIKHVSRNAKRQRKASRPLMPTTCKLRTAMQFVKHLDDPLKQLGGTMGQALTLFDLVDGFEEAVDRAQANGGDDWTHATDDALTRMAAFDNVAEEVHRRLSDTIHMNFKATRFSQKFTSMPSISPYSHCAKSCISTMIFREHQPLAIPGWSVF